MDATRQKKIENQLGQDMAEIFQNYAKEKLRGVIIGVTKTKVTPDLSVARFYLSIFPTTNVKEVIEGIRENKSSLRNLLGVRVRHQLRKIPDLEFFVDDSLDYIEKIEKELRGEGENPIKGKG